MESINDEGDAGPEQQLIGQQPRYLFYVTCFNVINRPASSLSFSSKICEHVWHVSVRMVKLRQHTRIFACLKVLSSKREAAYSLYDIYPNPLPIKRGVVWCHACYHGNKIFWSQQLSFSEMVICIVKQWKKSIGYLLFCSWTRAIMHKKCNYAQEIHTFQFLCLRGSCNLEKILNVSSHLEKSLNLVKVLEKYLISLFGLEKSLNFTTLLMPHSIYCEIRFFCKGKIWLVLGVRTCKTK